MVRYRAHNSHLVALIINQINQFYILNAYLFNISFTVIISFTFGIPVLLKGFYQNSGGIRHKTFPQLCVLLHVPYFLLSSHLCSCMYSVNFSFLILTYFLLSFFLSFFLFVRRGPFTATNTFQNLSYLRNYIFMRDVALASNKGVKV